METTFHRALGYSLFFHTVVILVTSVSMVFKKTYITIPVELIYYAPPVVAPQDFKEIKKEEEITIPKKVKPTPKKKEKAKEIKKEEPKPTPPPAPILHPSSKLTTDTAKFPYMYYLKNIRERISSNWNWSSGEGGILKTVVYFKIYRDGSITEPSFKEKSGDKVFDDLSLRAVKVSAPFPPLPSGYEEDTLGVYFEFAYKE